MTADTANKDPAELDLTLPEGSQSHLQELYEQHLHENERRLREAERLARLGHWELDFTDNTLHWSAETFRILELDPLDFAPSFETFMTLVHPDDRVYVEEQYRESIAHHSQYNVYHRMVLGSGTTKFVNQRCRTYYDAHGAPLRSLGTMLDMTDQEREVENLMRAKAGLEIYALGLEAEIEHLSDQITREREELVKARELLRQLKKKI